MSRLTEASSFAGSGLLVNALSAIPALIASGGTDVQAWAAVLAGIFGIFAIVKREGSAA